MKLRIPRTTAVLSAVLLLLPGCRPRKLAKMQEPTPSPSPSATARPTPTPVIYIPSKCIETAKLFNGLQVQATVDAEKGGTASDERDTPSSYKLDLQLKVKVPKPHSEMRELTKLNEHLPAVLPWLEAALPTAKISPFYDDFYKLKVGTLHHDLTRLDQLLSRQHFFDCETVLELQSTDGHRALLIQSAMDVDTDGSDGDRVPIVEGTSSTYQPMTSYKWPKKTAVPNPLLATSEDRLKKLETELAAKTTAAQRARDLRDNLVPQARYEVNQLKKSSFLVAAADPYIVLPGLLMSNNYAPYTPRVGDYCVVIFKDALYPALVGDVGPNYKIGEASLRICKEINTRSNGNNRPVSDLRVTYLVFPNSADKPYAVPDLEKWRARCDELLKSLGGYAGELHTWEDLTKPKPTPTPSPTPEQLPITSPSPTASPLPATSPTATPSPSPSATATP